MSEYAFPEKWAPPWFTSRRSWNGFTQRSRGSGRQGTLPWCPASPATPAASGKVRAGVGAAVGLGVEPLSAEEVVLDELGVGVEAQRLVIDEPPLRVGANHECRHLQPIPVLVHVRWPDVVVEPAPIVPGHEDRGR